MPSYEQDGSYASASSSRHAESSSHAKSTRYSDDRRGGSRSPSRRDRGSRVESDHYRSSDRRHDDHRRYDDDRRHDDDRRYEDRYYSHYDSRSSKYEDDRDHRDDRDARYDYASPRDYYSSGRHRSPERSSHSRYDRSPDRSRHRKDDYEYRYENHPSRGWDPEERHRLDPEQDRGAGRRHADDRDRRPSGYSDRTRNWRDESPERSRSSYRERSPKRPRYSDDYESRHHRDEHKSSRRRSRSRSRSPPRKVKVKRGADGWDEDPPSKPIKPEEGEINDAPRESINGSVEVTKELKRKEDGKERVPNPLHLPRSKQNGVSATGTGAGGQHVDDDHDDDKLERLASASKKAREINGVRGPTTNGDSSHRHANHSDAERRSSQPNGHLAESLRSDRLNGPSKDGQRESSSSSAPALQPEKTAPHASTKRDPAVPSAANKTTIIRSFEHVLLPHELAPELRAKNYLATADFKEGVKQAFKSAAEKQVVDVKVRDPRKGIKKPRCRELFYQAKFIWDANSVGNKPLSPPRNLVLTNFSGLVRPNQLLLQVRPFGRIESSKLEVDPKIGQSLGIFYVSFAHDFDEQGKVLESAPSGQTPQHGAKAAKAAQLALNNRQMGETRLAAWLDRSGEVLADKVKEKVAANEAKLKRPVPSPTPPTPAAPQVSASPVTPSASKPNMPPPSIPRGPRALVASSPLASSSSPSVRPVSERYETSSSRYSSSKYSTSGADESRRRDRPSTADVYNRRRDTDAYSSPRSAHLDRQSGSNAPSPSANRAESRKKQFTKAPTAEILTVLRNEKYHHIFIPKPKSCNVETAELDELLRPTLRSWTKEGDAGWYVAFDSFRDANACKIVHDTLTIGGYTLQLELRPPPPPVSARTSDHKASVVASSPAAGIAAQAPRKTIDTGLRSVTAEEKRKTEWTVAELQDAVYRMLQQEVVDTFIRGIKSRVIAPHLTAYLKPTGEGGEMLAKAVIKKPVKPSTSIYGERKAVAAGGDARLPSFRKLASDKPKKAASDAAAATPKSKRDKAEVKKTHSKDRRIRDVSTSDDESVSVGGTGDRARSKSIPKKRKGAAAARSLVFTDDEEDSDGTAATELDAASRSVSASAEPATDDAKARAKKKLKTKAETAAKKKGAAGVKKGAKASVVSAETDIDMDEGSETATPETEVPTKAAKTKKAPAKVKPIPADPFAAGIVEDVEDLYYLRMYLERLKNDEPVTEDSWPDEALLEAEADEEDLAAGKPPKHATGSARLEGFYKIPPEQKAAHLPDRNKATDDTETSHSAHILHSARNSRADSRRLVLGIEQHKRETATDTDIFKFNQLRTRKKQLKFAKSPIHDWGLYAMEFIPAGDMVIEYVGEVVRQQVADEREKAYERSGNFSTYLFRVDDDLVVDATHKGNIARLMNHCCTPNCNAKILTLNGEKRIVLFAKSSIRAGEELTYDYKFQASGDDEDAIPCLCGSPGCRRYL